MKTTILLPIFVLMTSISIKAQYVTCQSMPLAHGTVSTGNFSGDTLIIVPITNNSGTNFAYPLAKIIPVTPLPSGMTQTGGLGGWFVFASSWNDGQTSDANIHYNVTTPIPPDYMFSFILRVSNFSPLATDSCYFTDTMTVNLNPVATGIFETGKGSSVSVFPNPSNGLLNFVSEAIPFEEIRVISMEGKTVCTKKVNANDASVFMEDVSPGMAICCLKLANGETVYRKIIFSN